MWTVTGTYEANIKIWTEKITDIQLQESGNAISENIKYEKEIKTRIAMRKRHSLERRRIFSVNGEYAIDWMICVVYCAI